MANYIYPAFKGRQNGESGLTRIDLDTDTIKVMLVNTTYAALADSTKAGHDFRDDVTANEVTGTGYTAGGATLANKSLATVSTSNKKWDADDVSWTTSTITAYGAVLYKDVGTAATDPLIGFIDFGGAITSTAGTFLLPWHADGIMVVS